jgi:hypothetical protein
MPLKLLYPAQVYQMRMVYPEKIVAGQLLLKIAKRFGGGYFFAMVQINHLIRKPLHGTSIYLSKQIQQV